jgi:hypothetical protein
MRCDDAFPNKSDRCLNLAIASQAKKRILHEALGAGMRLAQGAN